MSTVPVWFGTSGRFYGMPYHGDPAACYEEAEQDIGAGNPLRRRRRIHGDRLGDGLNNHKEEEAV